MCDFCDNPNVVRRYQCLDFTAASKDAGVLYQKTRDSLPTNVVFHSTSYWAACPECVRYVDAEDIEGLLNHVAATSNAQRLELAARKAFLIHARHMYSLFFKNRIRVESVPVDSSRSSPQGETP
jgi:hypothetical protein